MGRIHIDQLLEGRSDQPNEVCLTMYFVEGGNNISKRIQDLLQPKVGRLDYRTAFRLPKNNDDQPYEQEAYKAFDPPEPFQSVFVFFIRPDVTSETLALQIIVSVLGQPIESWKLAATWLHKAWLDLFASLEDIYLGYSVAYQGSIDYEEETTPSVEEDLLGSLWHIHSHQQNSMLTPIAVEPVSQAGWLWLVRYPEVLGEGIIYIVLGRNKQSKHLASKTYATYHSLLCALDAFTHKTLRQGLELKKRYKGYEENAIKPLQEAVSQLLQHTSGSEELISMSHRIKLYSEFCWHMDRLAYSLKQQMSGINRLYLGDTMPAIARHHILRVNAYREEAQAIVDKNKDTLEIARTALSMAEATETKQANVNQERFSLFITFIGTFLTVEQILDADFIKELLTLLNIETPTVIVNKLPVQGGQPASIPYWLVFWSRIISAFIITLGLVFGIGWLIRQNKQISLFLKNVVRIPSSKKN